MNLISDKSDIEHNSMNLVPDKSYTEHNSMNLVPDKSKPQHNNMSLIPDKSVAEHNSMNLVPDKSDIEHNTMNLVPDNIDGNHAKMNLLVEPHIESKSNLMNNRKGILDQIERTIKKNFYKDAADASEYYFDRIRRKKEHGAKFTDNILPESDEEFEDNEA